eukprot:scaffold251728_cov36-Prasinocladus_malaysianus.AAC.1
MFLKDCPHKSNPFGAGSYCFSHSNSKTLPNRTVPYRTVSSCPRRERLALGAGEVVRPRLGNRQRSTNHTGYHCTIPQSLFEQLVPLTSSLQVRQSKW